MSSLASEAKAYSLSKSNDRFESLVKELCGQSLSEAELTTHLVNDCTAG